jgi:glycosyltransferase involved in cell wall biosynthesis
MKCERDEKSPEISVTIHGPNRWALQANNVSFQIEHHSEIEYLEKYSIANCDLLIAPSKFILDWAINREWQLPQRVKVMQNPYVIKELPSKNNVDSEPSSILKRKVICFFGRLEPRKGIYDFLSASSEFLDRADIYLVGGESPGNDPFAGFEKDSSVRRIKVLSNLSAPEAQKFFKENSALVVIPSRSENCPYVVIETAVHQNLILARNVGGIPELLDNQYLFDDTDELKLKMSQFLASDNRGISAHLRKSNDEAIRDYVELFDSLEIKLNESAPLETNSKSGISVIVAHYNQSQYLRSSLLSLVNQTEQNFECIAIDDGSTELHRLEFLRIEKDFSHDKRFKFFTKDNEDVGATRNLGVDKSEYDYVTFLDADDVMEENCLSLYVKCLESEFDVATSHFTIFESSVDKGLRREFDIASFEPFGACLDVLWFKNVIGGANFAMKKKTFNRLGGFSAIRGTTHHDWSILTRAAIQGIPIHVIPERLLRYRVVQSSMSRVRPHIEGQQRVISEYGMPGDSIQGELLRQLMLENALAGNFQAVKPMTYILAEKLRNAAERLCPVGSRRWRILAWFISKVLK